MFTGIIEALGTITKISRKKDNYLFSISSPFTQELKVDQSVAHDGVCLTVTNVLEESYEVIAISETIKKTNLKFWKENQQVNLERCLKFQDRIDGHIVQGHVDTTAKCVAIDDKNGSWEIVFEIEKKFAHLIVEKGSVCINGVSLTVFHPQISTFKVAIIPYTYEYTNIKYLRPGSFVNIEFDIIGKYFSRYEELRNVRYT